MIAGGRKESKQPQRQQGLASPLAERARIALAYWLEQK
jgi:hypothetical protein